MPWDTIALERRDALAVVTLARPRVGNRVTAAMARELREVCRALGEDDAVRAVVLTGAGRVFCAGGEVPRSARGQPPLAALAAHQAAAALASLGVPVVAALNGDALDQGLELALACDLRLAARTARLGLTHLARGLLPWDGGTQRLPRLIGLPRATELLLLGRLLTAREAEAWGLVHRVAPRGRLRAEALALAERVAEGAPIAARYAKEAVRHGADLSLPAALALEADLNVILQSTRDRREGIQAFLERRRPRFVGE